MKCVRCKSENVVPGENGRPSACGECGCTKFFKSTSKARVITDYRSPKMTIRCVSPEKAHDFFAKLHAAIDSQ